MIKFLDLQKQYLQIQDEINTSIQGVLSEAKFIGGEVLSSFENSFAKLHNAEYCIGVGNGTDALEIAIESLNLPKSSEIIVPANSFIASSEAVSRTGHKVVFCDCDEKNYTICPKSLLSKITSKTKAVIVVHLYGHPCDMDEVSKIAERFSLKVIEDCAQAHIAEYKGQKVGTLGDIGTFSFYPGKNLGAYGDGGAIITNNNDLAKKCKMIANHGRLDKYNHRFEGRNSRLDGIQAAVLNVKLKYLDTWTNKRISVAKFYHRNLTEVKEIQLPHKENWAKQVYHLFVIRTKQRDALQCYLKEMGIQTGVHYPISLPKLVAYEYLQQSNEPFIANSMDSELLSLPIGEHLEKEELEFIIKKIKEFFQ